MAAKKTDEGFTAMHRLARIGPRKVRGVLDLIRGLPVNDALAQLKHIHKRAAPMVAKVIKSAMANAQQEGNVDADDLVVAETYADPGPVLKRWSPRAMGRVYGIRRRTSHISVVLRRDEEKA
ncbi:MAG TPA: 50S ribosomal protein L22 [Planctomycetota bacterium]|jgi:large subunit ribosomal protein L22|nr:50S ribosomal protein L22 [Planctomycetota bacterium]OQC19586.1 MAG: 50S ribosomal protein L22 [Planctomycetes bacterium ADurb.Bin069]NMD36617.1 50S ribosomal protein L22 [Planctomycetota bacterium]HNR98997.1 50S ribosomal protein L22 [Planctomycetota bacterium]HNU27004.1 50S ribosomal protein L22 [Planctomycetota bacterium]